MSKGPLSKVPVPQPLDPRTISLSDYSKLQTTQMNKLAASLRSYKKSLVYVGGCLALSLVAVWYANKKAYQTLLGHDQRGGSYLNLTTSYDEDHYAYNREFQRMHVLGEAKIGDQSRHSKQLIRDYGVTIPELGNPHIPKRAPHEKFY